MAKKQGQTVKGCRKCGRGKKRLSRFGSPISLFVRDKISAKEYFRLTNQAAKTA
jgi:hypothetical protein